MATALFLLRLFISLPLAQGQGYETPKGQELLPPDPITAATEREGRIYVLYGRTAVVDTYDSEGRFLWAVSVPYHDHNEDAMMKLDGDSLFLYQVGHTVYEYHRADGRFLGRFDQSSAPDRFPGGGYQTHSVAVGEAEEGTLYFSGLQVLRGDCEGNLAPIISHSPWWRLLYFEIIWLIGFSSGIALLLTEQLFQPRRELREIAGARKEPRQKVLPQTAAAKIFLLCARITVVVNLVYLGANLIAVFAFHFGALAVGIFPVAIWFIVSNIVMVNRAEATHLCGTDALLVEMWTGYLWASFIAAFFSVAVSGLA